MGLGNRGEPETVDHITHPLISSAKGSNADPKIRFVRLCSRALSFGETKDLGFAK